MSLNILFIGDPHFQVNNIVEVNIFIEKIQVLAMNKRPDIIVIAGDILHDHERLHTMALNKAYELVNNMRDIAKTYILVGNHDLCNNQQFLTQNHWMNGMKEWSNTVIVDKVIQVTLKDKKLVLVPYVPPGRFEEALNTIGNDEWMNASCIFAHQEFYGCKMGAIMSIEGDRWPEQNPWVISGHIHSRQTPQTNVYYPGSAMQHAFGESDKNIIAHITFNSSVQEKIPYNIEEIDLQLPRKKIVYVDIEALEKYVVKDTTDQIKLTVNGDYEDFKTIKKTQKYKELVSKGVKVVFKPKKESIPLINDISNGGSNFQTILNSIVMKEKNENLMRIYEMVVNNKNVAEDDVFFL
jgi:DNA repair exonuclease SbcCD nuclease subunit